MRRKNRFSGFSYLGLLFFVAITAAALAALGQAWSTAAQRERERELVFRGEEIARAIASYASAIGPDPAVAPQFPTSLDDLLADRRGIKPRHHLRRAYLDPFTGKPDWVLVPEPSNPRRFNAVHSRSDQVLLRETQEDGTPVRIASDWVFAAQSAGAINALLPTAAPRSPVPTEPPEPAQPGMLP